MIKPGTLYRADFGRAAGREAYTFQFDDGSGVTVYTGEILMLLEWVSGESLKELSYGKFLTGSGKILEGTANEAFPHLFEWLEEVEKT